MKFFILQLAALSGIDADLIIESEGITPMLKQWYSTDDLDSALLYLNNNF